MKVQKFYSNGIWFFIIIIASVFTLGAGCESVDDTLTQNNTNENTNTTNSNTNEANTNTEPNSENWPLFRDEESGMSLRMPPSWQVYTTENKEEFQSKPYMLQITRTDLEDLPDIPLSEWDGPGDGWAMTRDTFIAEREMVESENVVTPETGEYTVPVKVFDNGKRAKAWLDGAEGVELVSRYSFYFGDSRIEVMTVLDSFLTTYDVSKDDVVDENMMLQATAPPKIQLYLEEFEYIAETVEMTTDEQ